MRPGDQETIAFNGLHDAYGFFSNFAAYPIMVDGLRWPTVEHYFQAQKFAGTPEGTAHQEAIRLAKSPMIAARMGRSRQRPLRPDWEQVKEAIMLVALRAKYQQHPTLREELLNTGAARIVEHRARDAYWGDGPDGSGKNRLGELLMQVRAEVRDAADPPASADVAHTESPGAYAQASLGLLE